MSERESLNESLRQECDGLLDSVVGALGCIDIGRGAFEYHEAMNAVMRLREIVGSDDD